MKYLITICLTAIAVVFLFSAAWVCNTEIREEGRMRSRMFQEYVRTHRPGPEIKTPTEKKQSVPSFPIQPEKL